MSDRRKWYTSREMEQAIKDVEPAAEWLRTHPPGARLPDELEPGYEPGDNMEPHWAIDDEVEIIASKMDGGQFRYHVRECKPPNREVVITYTGEGRMLFDGEDIETESFMAYVGLLDAIEESPGKVIHCKEEF